MIAREEARRRVERRERAAATAKNPVLGALQGVDEFDWVRSSNADEPVIAPDSPCGSRSAMNLALAGLSFCLALVACAGHSSSVRPSSAQDHVVGPAVAHVDASGEERHDLPATDDDVRILEGADAILSSEAVWNRVDTRECLEGAIQVSLFCALQKAAVNVLGKYDHRRAALQEVRFVIEEYGKEYEHRLMGFNNDPSRTFGDIKHVLKSAKERVQKRLEH
jgi:hypothetical protein